MLMIVAASIVGFPFLAKVVDAYNLLKMQASQIRFIPPALAKLRPSPPVGEGWQYEVKFDGFRVQLHKAGRTAIIFGKSGGGLTQLAQNRPPVPGISRP